MGTETLGVERARERESGGIGGDADGPTSRARESVESSLAIQLPQQAVVGYNDTEPRT